MIKKMTLFIITVIVSLFLTGCWDYREYEDMAYIVAIGVDFNREKDEITFTVQKLPSSKEDSGSSNGSVSSVNKVGTVHSATSKTIFDAASKIQQVITEKPFYGYSNVIVIGEDAAKYKMLDIIELFNRTPSIRATAYIVIADNAEKTISTVDNAKIKSSGQEIFELINQSSFTGISYPVTLQDFEVMLAIGGYEGTMPQIMTVSNENVEAKGGSNDSIRADEVRIGDQIVAGTSVFKGESFVGYLSEKESRGYCLITGKKLKYFETSELSGEEETEDVAFYHLYTSKSKIKVKFENNVPVIDLSIQLRADLRKDALNSNSDYLTPEVIKSLEEKLSASVRSDVEAALLKCQKEYKSDIFGFGFAVFRKDYKAWNNTYEKNWDNLYPDLQVNIEIDSKIANTGTNIKKFDVK